MYFNRTPLLQYNTSLMCDIVCIKMCRRLIVPGHGMSLRNVRFNQGGGKADCYGLRAHFRHP